MPSKNIASVLNNESNLKILDRLKSRPYYPRELAGEMGLSEPFIVRRLKAMEEYDIVEGRWETENGRKVKRYYVKDVTMQLGKDGLKVTSGEVPVKAGIDMKKEAIGYLIRLPLILVAMYAIIFDVPAILIVLCAYMAWSALNRLALYRTCRFKSLVIALPFTAVIILALLAIALKSRLPIADHEVIMPIATAVIVFILVAFISIRSRYYQLELDDLIREQREFVENLDDAPIYIKAFYLPMVVKWKLSEYFGLV